MDNHWSYLLETGVRAEQLMATISDTYANKHLTILDACCGHAPLYPYLMPTRRYVGFDSDEGVIKWLRKSYPEGTWICADAAAFMERITMQVNLLLCLGIVNGGYDYELQRPVETYLGLIAKYEPPVVLLESVAQLAALSAIRPLGYRLVSRGMFHAFLSTNSEREWLLWLRE